MDQFFFGLSCLFVAAVAWGFAIKIKSLERDNRELNLITGRCWERKLKNSYASVWLNLKEGKSASIVYKLDGAVEMIIDDISNSETNP